MPPSINVSNTDCIFPDVLLRKYLNPDICNTDTWVPDVLLLQYCCQNKAKIKLL